MLFVTRYSPPPKAHSAAAHIHTILHDTDTLQECTLPRVHTKNQLEAEGQQQQPEQTHHTIQHKSCSSFTTSSHTTAKQSSLRAAVPYPKCYYTMPSTANYPQNYQASARGWFVATRKSVQDCKACNVVCVTKRSAWRNRPDCNTGALCIPAQKGADLHSALVSRVLRVKLATLGALAPEQISRKYPKQSTLTGAEWHCITASSLPS